MTPVKFNVNQYISVRLTDYGREYLRLRFVELEERYNLDLEYTPPVEVDGWSTFQLWELMESFGPIIGLGAKLPFETEIILEVE